MPRVARPNAAESSRQKSNKCNQCDWPSARRRNLTKHMKKPDGEKLSRVLGYMYVGGVVQQQQEGGYRPTRLSAAAGCRVLRKAAAHSRPATQPSHHLFSPVFSHLADFVTAIQSDAIFVIAGCANECSVLRSGWREESPGSGIASGWRHLGGQPGSSSSRREPAASSPATSIGRHPPPAHTAPPPLPQPS